MIYLKLEKNKQLKVIQSAPLYQGENRADAIKVSLEDEYTPQGYICYLHLLSKDVDNKGDFIPVSNGEEYYLDNRFLTEDLNSICIWLELRKEADIVKTNPIEIVINKHYNIEEIIEDTDISAFEKLLQETTVLYADILKTKEEIEELVKDIEGDAIREELNSKAPLENPNFIGKVLVNDEEVLTESNIHKVAKTGNYNDLINKPAVDNNYTPSSSNAQSGIAVSEAIEQVVGNPPSGLDTIELVARSLNDSQETVEEMKEQLGNKIEKSDLSDYASKQEVGKIEDNISLIESGEILVGRAHKDALNRKIDETYATIEAITNIQNGVTTVGKSQIAQKAVKDNLGRTINTTYATSGDVQAAIAELVDSAPEALNTLEELAAALGNDENFSTTVMTEIGKKASNETVQNLSNTVEDILEGEITVKRSEQADYNSEGMNLATKKDIPTVDTEVNAFSDNPISNSAIVSYIENGYATKADVEAFETGSRIVAKSNCDSVGNIINKYYATKEEMNTRLGPEFANYVSSTFATVSALGLKQDAGDRANEINDTNLEEAGDSLYPSINAVDKYITLKIGDIETSLENIITKYGLGGETL